MMKQHDTTLAYSKLKPSLPPLPLLTLLLWFVTVVAWSTFAGLFIFVASDLVAASVGKFVGMAAPIAIVLFLIAAGTLARGARRVRDLSVLHYVAQAVRVNAPLVSMVDAAERSEKGGVRSRLRRLRLRLEDGVPIGAALAVAAPALGGRIVALITAGERTGQLASAMRRVVRRDMLPPANPSRSIFSRWYPIVLMVFCFVTIQLLMIHVLPKYDALFKDFRIPVPGLQRLEMLQGGIALIMLFGAGFGMLIVCGWSFSQIFTARGVTLGPLRVVVEAALWFLPVFGAAARNRALADSCHVTAAAMAAGLPLPLAMEEAALSSGNVILKGRLRKCGLHLARGADIPSAVRAARLPGLMRGMLAKPASSPELQEVLQFLCHYYDSRFSRSAALLRAAMIPLLVILVGIAVATIAFAVFEPLTELANKLTGR